jgi:gluconate:H+ symporter, GntP family
MSDPHNVFLISSALVAVIGLVVLITAAKLNPILGLIVVSVALGIAAGMPFVKAVQSFETGVGATLGHIALIVALGTMLGKMMAESGAAERIAHALVAFFGEKRVPWAMALIGIIVGLPAFFEVGFVLLVPVAFTVARRTGKSILLVGLPMLAGLSVAHGLVPPHPAATMAVTIFRADMGRTIFLGLAIGMVAAALAGPLFAQFAARRIQVSGEGGMAEQISEHHLPRALPGFWLSLFTILLPVLLMILGSCADALVAAGSGPNAMLHFIGNDDIALLIGVLVSFLTLGRAQGIARSTILRFTNECLAPTATITLLVGCGGGFGRILQDSGVSQAIVGAVTQSHFSLLLLAWLMAAALRLATGSATVATTTAAAIVAPIAAHAGAVRPELLVLATGAGSLIFSHVNDGGFWLVKEYFNLTVVQTLKTWSVCETIISVTGLVLTLAAARFI